MMTKKQLAMIQAAKRQLALTEQEYRGLLLRIGEVSSARDLTTDGFNALIRAFETLGFQRTVALPTARPGMASLAQLALVYKLWVEYAGEDSNERLRKWLERSYKISALRFMTADHAAMAINGLRVMIRRKAFEDAQTEKPSGAA